MMLRVLTLVVLAHAVPALAAGTIAGTITFSGPAPKVQKSDRKSDPFCSKTESSDPSVVLAKDGKALANVVVRIISDVAPAEAMPTEPVHINQKDCLYVPHVQGAVTGQKIQLKNGDETLHNVHAFRARAASGALAPSTTAPFKTLFNQAMAPGSDDIVKDPKGAELVRVGCDVHSWMSAYVVVSKHPYFAVSDADGRFEIKNVPPGSYKVEAWHEVYGVKTSDVKVDNGKAADPALGFSDVAH